MSDFKNSTSKQGYLVTSKLGKLGPNELYTGIVREEVKYDDMSTIKGNSASNESPDSDESEEVPLVEARAFINVANFFQKLREAIKEKHEEPESSEE
ncbi:unnamed protein product [Orchesella dallaii]|uniref:Uncharacterized protein n=1 Tax=Orchesella dallaii TaxID=48710 RepID=A0ABP1S772_9HEXA